MAELKYDKSGRLLFTKEMKQEYQILMPQMLPIHFELIKNVLRLHGYNVKLLTSTDSEAIRLQGLENVHNDTCYPALLVIGQMLDALKSGEYDLNKTALVITQTGGGCRASNYIHLLRKALRRSGMEQVPVSSVNLSGLEKNPGFKWSFRLIRELVASAMYGDILMLLRNQVRPYEVTEGDAQRLTDEWVLRLSEEFKNGRGLKQKEMVVHFNNIVKDFAKLPVNRTEKVKVGIVGEIYIKYSPLGNNNLEEFLLSEGAEVFVPGLMDFIIFKIDNRIEDYRLYGGKRPVRFFASKLMKYVLHCQRLMLDAVRTEPSFYVPGGYEHLKALVNGYIGYGAKMGEGWLLTAEMLELISDGVGNIVCAQPFGCLPNHVVGKGMVRSIKTKHPEANIVAIDYDPGATKVNQENRIKLMLAVARSKMEKEHAGMVEDWENTPLVQDPHLSELGEKAVQNREQEKTPAL